MKSGCEAIVPLAEMAGLQFQLHNDVSDAISSRSVNQSPVATYSALYKLGMHASNKPAGRASRGAAKWPAICTGLPLVDCMRRLIAFEGLLSGSTHRQFGLQRKSSCKPQRLSNP